MPSASELRKRRGGGQGGELLKGSSLPQKQNSVTVYIIDVRESPEEFRSPLIIEIGETFGCTSYAPNATALKTLESEIGDDYEKWPGHEVKLAKVRTTNPSTHKPAWGLEVESAKKSKRKPPKRVNDDDVPF